MDSSLRTLELMASEVGATVLVLKEIVLSHPRLSTSSSISSLSSISGDLKLPLSTIGTKQPNWDWVIRRPDLIEPSEYKKARRKASNQSLNLQHSRSRSWGQKEADDHNAERRIVFSNDDMRALSSDEDDDDLIEESEPRPATTATASMTGRSLSSTVHSFGSDADVPVSAAALARADIKARKASARREARRMDLLNGDGMSGLLADLSAMSMTAASGQAEASASASEPRAHNALHPSNVHLNASFAPHQPTRPSSLRLASPAPRVDDCSDESDSDGDDVEDDSFVDLLHVPLDSPLAFFR